MRVGRQPRFRPYPFPHVMKPAARSDARRAERNCRFLELRVGTRFITWRNRRFLRRGSRVSSRGETEGSCARQPCFITWRNRKDVDDEGERRCATALCGSSATKPIAPRPKCHTPLVWSGVMEIEFRTRFACLWCGETFARRCHTGRKPSYCTQSHRQRAYEARRRDLHRAHHPVPPPTQTANPVWPPRPVHHRDYAAGHHFDGRTKTVIHALRGDGHPNLSGRHLTLCGAWAKHENRPFSQAVRSGMSHHDPCATCINLAAEFPAPHSTDHFGDLTRLRAHIGRRRNRRNEPWLRQLIDECFPQVHAPLLHAPIA